LSSFDQILGVTFVVNGQLFASVNAVVRIGGDPQPYFSGTRVFSTTLGHLRQLAARFGAKFHR
jgi:hypothetical protein